MAILGIFVRNRYRIIIALAAEVVDFISYNSPYKYRNMYDSKSMEYDGGGSMTTNVGVVYYCTPHNYMCSRTFF